MNIKYQIFISSTYEDLKVERETVRDTILKMGHLPVGMEQFGAADEKQWEIISKQIDTSDYYVLIIGNRYGSIIKDGPDAGMSYTEKEMRYAAEQGVPILAFIVNDTVPVAPEHYENDEHRSKLKEFKKYVKDTTTVGFWHSADHLAAEVSTSLYKQIDRTPRLGWVRGGEIQDPLKEVEHKSYRQPELDVFLSVSDTVEGAEDKFKGWDNSSRSNLKYRETNNGLVVHMQKISTDGYLRYAQELLIDDIPDNLKEYVHQKDVDEYNSSLPSKEEIENYNIGMSFFRCLKENGLVLNVSVANKGTAKATDIYVSMEIPDSFIVYEKAKAIDLVAPTAPKMPKNPIDEADIKYNLSKEEGVLSPIEQFLHLFGESCKGMDRIALSQPKSAVMAELLNGPRVNGSVSVEEHAANVHLKSLMHTSKWSDGYFCIAPTMAGEFSVKISAICEELPEPVETEYKIVVVEE